MPTPTSRSTPSIWSRLRSPVRWTANSVLACTLAAFILTAPPTIAFQPDQPAGKPVAPARTTVITLEKADLDKILIDPKDAALKAALRMLPARMRELRNEIPDGSQMPLALFDLVARLAGKPARMGIEYNPQNTDASPVGAGVVLSFGMGSEKEAGEVHALISSLVQKLPDFPATEPAAKPYQGMDQIETPAGLMRWGPRQSAAGGWRYEMVYGSLTQPDAMFKDIGAPFATAAGEAVPFFRASFDPAALTPLVNIAATFLAGEPGTSNIIPDLVAAGSIGPDAVRHDYTMGFTADRFVSTSVDVGLKKFGAKGGYNDRVLGADDFRMIPADAYAGGLSIIDIKPVIDGLNKAIEASEQGGQVLGRIKKMTSVDFMKDVLGSMGGVFGHYTAESTGGGGLGSVVAFASLSDSKALDNAMAKIATFANNFLAQRQTARGYIAMRPWQMEGTGAQFYSIRFPGLPIPIEPTFTVTEKWLIMGLTPQACVAAARQSAGKGDGGCMSNTAIAGMFPKGKSFTSASFNDVSKTMRSGYPILSMLGSGMGNLVRSHNPDDKSREPGMIVPTYGELMKGAQPQVAFTYWSGDDRVSESYGDRSMLVNFGASAGAMSPFLPIIVGAAAAVGIAANEQQGGGLPFHMGPGGMGPGGDDDDAPPPPPPPPVRRGKPNFMIIPDHWPISEQGGWEWGGWGFCEQPEAVGGR